MKKPIEYTEAMKEELLKDLSKRFGDPINLEPIGVVDRGYSSKEMLIIENVINDLLLNHLLALLLNKYQKEIKMSEWKPSGELDTIPLGTVEEERELYMSEGIWEDLANERANRIKAEDQVKELRQALETISQWDVLNPPRKDLLSDLTWLKQLVDKALGKNDTEES